MSERHFPTSESVMSNLIKPESDTKEYRYIRLKNGLKALLISDTAHGVLKNSEKEDSVEVSSENEFSKSSGVSGCGSKGGNESQSVKTGEYKEIAACALCVGVGTFSDPPEIPGLAHMLEHAVFMGSEKYPGSSSFDSFVKRHGGNNNGETESERTLFYFECCEISLKDSMDRFAQFFISPLLSKEDIMTERENMQSEFEDCLLSNTSRKLQLFFSLAPDGHPAKKFSWGNLKTLRDDVDVDTLYNSLHEFRKRHYSAHRMTFAVQGRQSLDTLESYVTEIFSNIPNNNLPADDFSPHYNTYGNPEYIHKLVWMKPIKKINQVQINWVLPSYVGEYRSRPLDYIGWFFDYYGEGSLTAYLNKRIWALECEGGNDGCNNKHNTIFSLFTVLIKLTEEGLSHLKEVIAAIFSYLAMMRENGPSKAIFDELEYSSRCDFRFRKEWHPADYVQSLAESMQVHEPEHIIAGGYLYFEYRPELIMDLLNQLTPDRANIMILNDTNDDSFYDKVEPWFGTLYKVTDIPEDWLELWKNIKPFEEFHYPAPNPYLTTNFSLLEVPEGPCDFPMKIIDDDSYEIWHLQDTKFHRPLAFYNISLMSPTSWVDPRNTVMLEALLSFLDKRFIEVSAASEANLYYEFFRSKFGMTLNFQGYNEKLPVLFDEVLTLLPKHLAEVKDEKNRELMNVIIKNMTLRYYNRLLKPEHMTEMIRYNALSEYGWTAIDYLRELSDVTPEEIYDYGVQFFTNTFIIGLIQGNVTKSQAMELGNKLKSFLNVSPVEKIYAKMPILNLPKGGTYFKVKSLNPEPGNSAILNYYQFGPTSLRDSCILELIMIIMDNSLFNDLRTEQRIGYVVYCEARNMYGILGFHVLITFQSEKFDSEDVDERIDDFLMRFPETLKTVSPQEFKEMKKGLCSTKQDVELDLGTMVVANFEEICHGQYVFDRHLQEISIIQDLKLEDLCSWYDKFVQPENFKKMSIQVIQSRDLPIPTEDYELDVTLLPGTGTNKDKYVLNYEEYLDEREFYSIEKMD